jgi:hypothetical protein
VTYLFEQPTLKKVACTRVHRTEVLRLMAPSGRHRGRQAETRFYFNKIPQELLAAIDVPVRNI